jgi:hypothetical protein
MPGTVIDAPPLKPWQDLCYRPFISLLALGVLLRAGLMLSYFPAVMLMSDSPRYARVNGMPLFSDFWMPAGYPMFLKLLHALSHQLWFTISIQHVMGLGVGILLFLSVRRLGVSRAVACIPAAVPLLSGDHLYLEHLIMADHPFSFLATVGLSAAVFGLVPQVNLRWLATGSAFLAMAALTRSVGIALLPILLICTALWVKGSLAARCGAIAAALLPGVAVFGLYIAAFYLARGQYLGLTDMSGWNLYSRVAPFADCSKFTPPEGTAILCEQRPPSKRPGPFGYVWDLSSTPRRQFPLGPATGAKLRQFATQAILHQPTEYLMAVLFDLIRYIDPVLMPRRPYGGQSPEILSFGWRDRTVEQRASRAMAQAYSGTKVRLHGQALLAFYQNVFRLSGAMISAALVFSLVGLAKSPQSIRPGIGLYTVSAVGLYLLPVLTLSYDFRYGIPPQNLIAVSGTLGAVSLLRQGMLRIKRDGVG